MEQMKRKENESSLNLSLNLLLERCRTSPPNILHTLLAVQEQLGSVPPGAVPAVARALQVTEADVAGVLSFYPDLREKSAGRHLIRVCLGESCVANHCRLVLSALAEELRIGLGATTADNRFTLDKVYCVGNCAVAPTVMIDEQVHGRVSPGDVPGMLEKYR